MSYAGKKFKDTNTISLSSGKKLPYFLCLCVGQLVQKCKCLIVQHFIANNPYILHRKLNIFTQSSQSILIGSRWDHLKCTSRLIMWSFHFYVLSSVLVHSTVCPFVHHLGMTFTFTDYFRYMGTTIVYHIYAFFFTIIPSKGCLQKKPYLRPLSQLGLTPPLHSHFGTSRIGTFVFGFGPPPTYQNLGHTKWILVE